MIDIYAELRKRKLTHSARHFSLHWCGRAPNYLAMSSHLSDGAMLTIFRKLLAEGRWLLAYRVANVVLFGRRPQDEAAA